MCKKCYITTPIYYASGNVHIGNSYTTVVCDVYSRYHRLKKDQVHFLTGMDEHGQKIEEAAAKANKTPQEFVDEVAKRTLEVWKKIGITNDDFICTSEQRHTTIVQEVFEQLLQQGDIYLGSYEGNYCVSCEAFFTKTQLQEGELCPDCGKKTVIVQEESYFLKLKKYEKQLLDFIKNNPDFIQPQTRRNEVVSFIEQGLEDLCVSRTSFKWGIPVKSNPKHVVYVWIDALMNYLTVLGYKTANDKLYQDLWINGDEVIHVVGKDILRFHAIYWPILLMALNVPIKFKLYVHGWILMKEGKMSKSRGNTVYPKDVSETYGLDSLRYYLTKELPLGNDGLFTWERFMERYNVDLANDLGNLTSRTIAMINKYFNGVVKKETSSTPYDQELEQLISTTVSKYVECFDNFQFQNGLNEIWNLISNTNKYIDKTTPWILAKDETKKDQLNAVMYHLYEVLRIVGIMISPVMIETSPKMFELLNVNKENQAFSTLKYGLTNEVKVVEQPSILFKRLDIANELKKYES